MTCARVFFDHCNTTLLIIGVSITLMKPSNPRAVVIDSATNINSSRLNVMLKVHMITPLSCGRKAEVCDNLYQEFMMYKRESVELQCYSQTHCVK